MGRRSLFILAATITLLGILAPTSAHAQGGAMQPPLIDSWFSDTPYDVEIDPATGNFHVLHHGDQRNITVHDATGRELWNYANDRRFESDLAIGGDAVYVAKGKEIFRYQRHTGALIDSWEVAADSIRRVAVTDDRVFVLASIIVDPENLFTRERVHVYRPDGTSLGLLTGHNTAGEIERPRAIAVEGENVYVLDTSDVVHIFDTAKRYQRSIDVTVEDFAVDIEVAGRALWVRGSPSTLVHRFSLLTVSVPSPGGGPIASLSIHHAPTAVDLGPSSNFLVDPSGETFWTAGQNAVNVFSFATCFGKRPTVVGTSYADRFDLGSGDDIAVLGNGDDTVGLGEGNDVACAGGGRDTVDGGPGVDRVHGGDGRDVLTGGDQRDFLYGGRSPDTLVGGAGRDVLRGGAGADRIEGGNGNDRLIGGGGDDTLLGERGRRDRLIGGGGQDDCIDSGRFTMRFSCP